MPFARHLGVFEPGHRWRGGVATLRPQALMGAYGKHTRATIARDLPRRKSSRVEVRTDVNDGSSTAGAWCVEPVAFSPAAVPQTGNKLTNRVSGAVCARVLLSCHSSPALRCRPWCSRVASRATRRAALLLCFQLPAFLRFSVLTGWHHRHACARAPLARMPRPAVLARARASVLVLLRARAAHRAVSFCLCAHLCRVPHRRFPCTP